MADVPVYRSQVGAPNIGSISIAPVGVPDLHSGEGLSQGAQELGRELTRYATAKKAAEDETRANTAMTGFLTSLDQAETAAAQNPDYATAPTDFRAQAAEYEQQALDAANLDPGGRARFELGLRQHTIAGAGRVDTAALGKHVDAAGAVRGELALKLSRAAATAASEVEASAMIDQQLGAIDRDVRAGVVAADKGEAEKQAFLKSVSDQKIRSLIRTDPHAAEQMLSDPSKLPGLSGSELETFRAATEAAKDEAQKYHLLTLAGGSKPEQASLAMNKVLSPQHADLIFYNHVLPVESGGAAVGDRLKRNQQISKKGAVGLAQIIPDTAREMAAKAGLTAISKMSNAEITAYLQEHPETDEKLGLMYWHENLAAFDNNPALAAAGYNAGKARAKEYQAGILAKYGPDATPLEIATYIGDQGNKETHDYILKMFGHGGVPPTGPGVSLGARYPTAVAVQTAVDKQQTEADRIIKDQAAMDRATGGNDMIDELNKSGVSAWTPQFETILQHNIQAAAAGSPEAAAFVQKASTWQEAKPSTDAAWRMPPARLADEVTRLGALAAAGGATHADLVQLAAFKAVQTEIGTNYKTDPVGLGARAGMFVAQSLDPNAAPGEPGFLQSLAVRGRQATAAERLYGTLAPFRPKEVDALKQRFAEASAVERNALLGALAGTLDQRVYNAAITQLGLDATTASAGRFAQTAPELTKKALVGAELLKTPGIESGAKALTDAAATKLGGDLYPPGSTALADVTRLATAVYAANSGLDATLFEKPNAELMATSLEEITGKITTIGARQTAAPIGMSASQFEASLAGVTDETLQLAGGGYDGAGREIHADDIRDHAVLIQKAPRSDEYFVGVPAPGAPDGYRLYHTKDARPLVLNMRQVAAEQGRAAAAAARDAAGRATLRDITETGGLPGAGGALMEMPLPAPEPPPAPATPAIEPPAPATPAIEPPAPATPSIEPPAPAAAKPAVEPATPATPAKPPAEGPTRPTPPTRARPPWQIVLETEKSPNTDAEWRAYRQAMNQLQGLVDQGDPYAIAYQRWIHGQGRPSK